MNRAKKRRDQREKEKLCKTINKLTPNQIKLVDVLAEQKADKLLDVCTTDEQMFKAVRNAYNNDLEFIMNASVLWILRSLDDKWEDRFYAYIQE